MERHPTEEKVLAAVISIIDERGEAAVRIQDVQNMVGVTAPSIYHFFGSREGLIIEAQTERLRRSYAENDPMIDEILGSVSSEEELGEAMEGMLMSFFDPSRAVARERRVSALGAAAGRPELAKRFAQVLEEYVEVRAQRLQPFQDKGWIRADVDLRAFNFLLMGVIFGRTYIEIGGSETPYPEWDEMARKACAFVLFGPDWE